MNRKNSNHPGSGSRHVLRRLCSALVIVSSVLLARASAADDPPASPTPAQEVRYVEVERGTFFTGAYHTMSEAIVGTITADVAEMGYMARTGMAPDPGDIKVEVRTLLLTDKSRVRWKVRITDPDSKVVFDGELDGDRGVFAPELYDVALRACFPPSFAMPEKGARTVDSLPTLRADLLDGKLETVLNKSRIVTNRLAERSNDPQVHAEAALVLGAFAMLDMGYMFYDVRPALCRMSTHLAVAHLLGAGSFASPELHLATAIQNALVLREEDALEALDRLAKIDPSNEAAAWARALRLRMTHDTRILDGVKDPSVVERREVVAAGARSRGPEWTITEWRTALGKDRDVWRALNHMTNDSSVYGTNLEVLLPASVGRAAKTYEMWSGRELSTKDGMPPEMDALRATYLYGGMDPAKSEPAVIGWGLVAGFLMRDMMDCAFRAYYRLGYQLGDREEAAEFADFFLNMVRASRFSAFFEFYTATKSAPRAAAYDRVVGLAHTEPENLPLVVWIDCSPRKGGRWDQRTLVATGVLQWMVGHVPVGTAYGWNEVCPMVAQFDVDEPVNTITQNDFYLKFSRNQPMALAVRLAAQVRYQEPSPELVREAFGGRWDYDANGLRMTLGRILNASPDVLMRIAERICEMDPNQGDSVVATLPASIPFEQKLPLLEAHLRNGTATIGLSNRCLDAVMHYITTGDLESAKRWADMGEQVYSQVGLTSKVEYLLHVQKFDEAISVANNMQVRYDDREMVLVCIVRQVRDTGTSPYLGLLEDHLGHKFPDGLTSITEEYRKSPPTHGVKITSIKGDGTRLGFLPGDTIVACNGYLIPKKAHGYGIVRYMRPPTDLSWVVYRNGEYLDIRGGNKTGRFGIFFEE